MGKALGRFVREDPTFRSRVDPESGETVISGMGELHLEVYVERMKREYSVEVETGAPQVAYRETISRRAEFDYTHKKQTGGSGQYGRVAGYVEPLDDGTDFEFVSKIRGGSIPTEYIPAVEKGVRQGLDKGRLIGFPVQWACASWPTTATRTRWTRRTWRSRSRGAVPSARSTPGPSPSCWSR